jgi:hypothetical protein
MADFLSLCLARAGADEMITPREIIRDYITVLNILIQNDDARFEDIVKSIVKESTAVCENMPVQTTVKREYTPEDIEF